MFDKWRQFDSKQLTVVLLDTAPCSSDLTHMTVLVHSDHGSDKGDQYSYTIRVDFTDLTAVVMIPHLC